MLLQSTDGEPFSTGSASYDHSTRYSESELLIVQIQIEDFKTEAVVDTGAPFVVCTPQVAEMLDLEPDGVLYEQKVLIRGSQVKGDMYRVTLHLLAEVGENLVLEVTAFIIRADEVIDFGSLPPMFLGLLNCLESIRFAFDPASKMWHFSIAPHLM